MSDIAIVIVSHNNPIFLALQTRNLLLLCTNSIIMAKIVIQYPAFLIHVSHRFFNHIHQFLVLPFGSPYALRRARNGSHETLIGRFNGQSVSILDGAPKLLYKLGAVLLPKGIYSLFFNFREYILYICQIFFCLSCSILICSCSQVSLFFPIIKYVLWLHTNISFHFP